MTGPDGTGIGVGVAGVALPHGDRTVVAAADSGRVVTGRPAGEIELAPPTWVTLNTIRERARQRAGVIQSLSTISPSSIVWSESRTPAAKNQVA